MATVKENNSEAQTRVDRPCTFQEGAGAGRIDLQANAFGHMTITFLNANGEPAWSEIIAYNAGDTHVQISIFADDKKE
jgi:hypothetical protein